MNKKCIIFSLLFMSTICHAEPINLPSPWTFFCNSQKSNFSISADENYRPIDKSFKRQKIDWIRLLKFSSLKDKSGEPFKAGSSIVKKRCGSLDILFSSGFLNPNIQGELGAMDFMVIEIRHKDDVLLPPTALEQCTLPISRYEYFGKCPDAWAQLIEVRSNSKTYEIKIHRIYTDEEFVDIEKNDTFYFKKIDLSNTDNFAGIIRHKALSLVFIEFLEYEESNSALDHL